MCRRLLILSIFVTILAAGIAGRVHVPFPGRLFTLGTATPALIRVEQFGASPSASAIANVAAFRAAIDVAARSGGGTILVGRGIYRLDSKALGRAGLTMRSGVTIRGSGRDATRLVVTGSAICNVFTGNNLSDITYEDVALTGNGAAAGEGDGGAIIHLLTKAAASDMQNIRIRNVDLRNFASPYWIMIENQGNGADAAAANSTAPNRILGIVVDGIHAVGQQGNSIDPGKVTVHAHVLKLSGYSGEVVDYVIRDMQVDATYIKGAISIQHQARNGRIERPVVQQAGRHGALDDAGAYAIEIYDTYQKLSDLSITDAIIKAPRSCGIYVAGARGITITNPSISGQTDTAAGTLPKAAIAFNGTLHPSVKGGKLSDNWRAISLNAPSGEETRIGARIDRVSISSRVAGSIGIWISYSPFLAEATDVRISGVTIDVVSRGIAVQNSPDHFISGVSIIGGSVRSRGSNAIDLLVDNIAGSLATDYVIEDVKAQSAAPTTPAILTGRMRSRVRITNVARSR